ncbi:MAG: MFS transporter [Geminicoccaceae bacterium]
MQSRAYQDWRTPENLLIGMAVASSLAFSLWMTLINNFSFERAGFDGVDIGILQSVREIPGFLAFTIVFVLLLVREQALAIISLVLLTFGTLATGLLPSFTGLLVTTTIMSIGFHYLETIKQSLSLQWTSHDRAPLLLGRLVAARGFASIVTLALVWLAFDLAGMDYAAVYAIGGGLSLALTLFLWWQFPQFKAQVEQHKHIVLRKRYWLYYALTFLSGARRQIFVVFAGFLLVEKFGYAISTITLLYLANSIINFLFASSIGALVGRVGERAALLFEYAGLVVIFTAYAFVEHAGLAAALYILDHLFFAFAIAIQTYLHKIADPADLAPTAGVAFTINHIAAVFIPVLFGLIWMYSPALVFLCGALLALASFLLSFFVPDKPAPGRETTFEALPVPTVPASAP